MKPLTDRVALTENTSRGLFILVLLFVMLIGVTVLGFTIRRGCGLKWVLVILTFEGAIRIGMLLHLLGTTWRELLK